MAETKEEKGFDARITGNVQNMLDNNFDTAEIQRYLKDVEGIEIDYSIPVTPEARTTSAQETFTNPRMPVTFPGMQILSSRGGQAAARGAVKGMFGLGSMAALAADGVRYLWDEALEASGVQSKQGNTFDATGFQAVNEGGRLIGEALFDPDFSFEKGRDTTVKPGLAERTAEKVGEFVLPGATITKSMTNIGARLAAKNPQFPNILQRMFLDAAKNPGRVQAFEAGLNTTAAAAGEMAVTMAAQGGNPEDLENAGWIRFAAEMSGLGFGVIGARLGSKVKRFAEHKLMLGEGNMQRAAKLKVGEFFDEIMQADPNILKHVDEVVKMEKELGMSFLTSDVFQNPTVQAAMNAVVATGKPATATRYIRMLEAGTARIKNFEDTLRPIVNGSGNMQPRIKQYVERELGKIDRRIELAVKKSVAESESLHPGRTPQEIGDSAIVTLRALEAEDMAKVDALYNQLDNGQMYPLNYVKQSVAKASVSKKTREINAQRAKDGLPPLPGLANKEFGDIPEELIETALANFGDGKHKANLLQLREWRQEIGSAMRHAKDADTINRLDVLRKGVDKQLESIANMGPKLKKQNQIFKEANAMYAEVKQRYDKGFAAAMLNKDIAGRTKLAPEDFTKNWIRRNGSKDSVRAVQDFKNAFGETPVAKALIRDAVAWEISQLTKDGRLNIPRVQSWLKARESNLRAHGIWESFNTVGKAELAARGAEKIGVRDKKKIENGILGMIVKTNDVDGFIRKQMRANKLGETRAQIHATKDMAAMRAFTRKAFDAVLSTGDTASLDSVEQMIKNPDAILINLQNHEKDLIAGLGKEHYGNLVKLARIWRLNQGKVQTFGAVPSQLAITAKFTTPQMESAMSKIRASLQGFVSPEYTAVQLANQAMNRLTHGAAQKIMEEAMFNWRFALELAGIARTAAGKEAVRAIGTAAVPATLGYLEEDDERTDY